MVDGVDGVVEAWVGMMRRSLRLDFEIRRAPQRPWAKLLRLTLSPRLLLHAWCAWVRVVGLLETKALRTSAAGGSKLVGHRFFFFPSFLRIKGPLCLASSAVYTTLPISLPTYTTHTVKNSQPRSL